MAINISAAGIIELRKELVPKRIFEHSILLGFGAICTVPDNPTQICVRMIVAPIYQRMRHLNEAISLEVDIKHLCYLSVRMHFINGKIRGLKTQNKQLLHLDFQGPVRPEFVPFSSLPFQRDWSTPVFKQKFPDFGGANYCALRANHQGKDIVAYLPSTEVLRFYYPHSCLIEALFSGNPAKECLYSPKGALTKNSRPFVKLQKKIYDVCAPHVARVRFSRYAELEFERVFTDSRHAKTQGYPNYEFIKARPPINVDCSWLVEVQETALENALLIISIKRCDAAFPFERLLFGRDNDGRSETNRPNSKQKYFVPTTKVQIDDTEGLSLSLNHVSNVSIETLDVTITFDEELPNFSALEKMSVKKIEKVSTIDPDTQRIKLYTDGKALDALAASGYLATDSEAAFIAAEFSRGSVSLSKELNRKTDISNFDAFLVFQRAVEALAVSFDIHWQLISVWNRRMQQFYLNIFTERELKAIDRPWLYLNKREFDKSVNEEQKIKNVRKFVVAEISFDDSFVYLVDFEKRKSGNKPDASAILLIHLQTFDRMARDELKTQIISYVKNKRAFKGSIRNVNRDTITHQEEPELLKKRLEKRVTSALGSKIYSEDTRLTD